MTYREIATALRTEGFKTRRGPPSALLRSSACWRTNARRGLQWLKQWASFSVASSPSLFTIGLERLRSPRVILAGGDLLTIPPRGHTLKAMGARPGSRCRTISYLDGADWWLSRLLAQGCRAFPDWFAPKKESARAALGLKCASFQQTLWGGAHVRQHHLV
jgi:hypothetical protein